MPDNPSKLQNVQLPAQSGDGLRPGVVEMEGGNGGAIGNSTIPSAAKEGVEGLAAYRKYLRLSVYGDKISKYLYGVPTQRHLP